MHLSKVNEAFSHKITSGSEYGWQCWDDARYLDYESDFAHVSVVYNTKTQDIYQAEVSVKHEAWAQDEKPYRWLDPRYKDDMINEAKERKIDADQAWDDVKWIDLEVEEDFFEKATAMFNGEEWDNRIQVPLDLDDGLLLQLAMEAHKRDITLNKMVEIVLQEAIDCHRNDNLTR
jgi:hypothetical protein